MESLEEKYYNNDICDSDNDSLNYSNDDNEKDNLCEIEQSFYETSMNVELVE